MTTPDRPGALSERLAALVGQAAAPARPAEETGPSVLEGLQAQVRELASSVAAVHGQLGSLSGEVEASVERAVVRAVPPPAEPAEVPEPEPAPDVLGALDGRADALEDRLATTESLLGASLAQTQQAVDALGASVRDLLADVHAELGAMEARLGAHVDEAALALAEAIVGLVVAGVPAAGAPATSGAPHDDPAHVASFAEPAPLPEHLADSGSDRAGDDVGLDLVAPAPDSPGSSGPSGPSGPLTEQAVEPLTPAKGAAATAPQPAPVRAKGLFGRR